MSAQDSRPVEEFMRNIAVSTELFVVRDAENEVHTVFADELEGLDREHIMCCDHGYNWMSEAVYNPFDMWLVAAFPGVKTQGLCVRDGDTDFSGGGAEGWVDARADLSIETVRV